MIVKPLSPLLPSENRLLCLTSFLLVLFYDLNEHIPLWLCATKAEAIPRDTQVINNTSINVNHIS